jgi:hypothetical protein
MMAAKTKAQLEAENAQLRADLAKAGQFFNDAADANDLCEQYDCVVLELNDELVSDYRFTPRGKEQTVSVELTAVRGTTVKVVARDITYAEDRASDMSTEGLFGLAGHSDLYAALKAAGFDPSAEVI